MNKINTVIVVLVLAVIVASLVVGGGTNIIDTGSNETEQGQEMGEQKVDQGSCVNECRMKHPADTTAYEDCKESMCS